MSPRPPPRPALPSFLFEGRYLAESLLTRGETSEVFSGSDSWSGEQVAIRRLRADRLDRRTAFERMAERMFGMASARLVRAIAMGEDRVGLPFLVTELLVGRGAASLANVRWEVAAEITRQAAAVIAEMHLSGLHHGSLSVSSFFVAASNAGGSRVKLLDLGTGARGATAGGDVRALGVMLHGLLESDLAAVPRPLADAVARWLAPDADGATAAELAAELKKHLDAAAEEPERARPMPGPRVLPKSSVIMFDDGSPGADADPDDI